MRQAVPFYSTGGKPGAVTLARAAWNGSPFAQVATFADTAQAVAVAGVLNAAEVNADAVEAARAVLALTDQNRDPADALEALREALAHVDAQAAGAVSKHDARLLAALAVEAQPGDFATVDSVVPVRWKRTATGWRKTLVMEGDPKPEPVAVRVWEDRAQWFWDERDARLGDAHGPFKSRGEALADVTDLYAPRPVRAGEGLPARYPANWREIVAA